MNNYFDYAASTPVSDIVLDAMHPWQSESFANPSATHDEANIAAKAIQHAREVIANEIGAMPSEIIFTSGASEANNLALKGIAFQNLEDKGHIITSSIEHKCILNTCAFLESIGFEVTYLNPNRYGVIEADNVTDALRSNTLLISIHHVNNELGTIQPVDGIGDIAFEHDIPFHTDAAQSFCKLKIDVDDMNIDMLSLSGHKIYGPKGIGVLYVREARESGLVPLIHGGGQELGLRGGTSPTPLIVGLGAALEHFPCSASEQQTTFEQEIQKYHFGRNGGDNVLPSTWSITFSNDDEVKRFTHDQAWLISQGSACNAMSNTPSHVLSAVGLSEEEARRTYRISLPPFKVMI
ncbi:Cysteine desulfurase, mitosomal [Vibrio nigripulchritudo SFn27]|uniref:cysteine desulfurase n=1 Tax=Vibrio nigripulchritudo TaxID=28173 RepID=U4KG23_9VIBR|nr:cysteine desulfurase family protein [Vibrio nigripulchritudo]CCN82728.1 Cysteine desulfurase, mitosomal [Vibrio nigripulchritudo BLFn1]CCN89878.1 Cysteine desulfurase, mitosomal [Vibrio nigripulchritudo SFn27]CCN92275.1 Cysteine desulfurase, mitosomal [Vibrio nigripulchritudo ENn2]CCO43762.1 Cysteine desulfurase, mitosomal [Vibrio nigripulchritudo SFn135]CCO53076.1 Cysteine desulfurase, mitosomal [Vibrio nigripulchritudo Wn13]